MDQIPKKSNTRVVVIFAVVLVMLIAAAAAVYAFTRPAASAGEKNITVEIIIDDEVVNTHSIHTDEEYLAPVLLAEDIAEGDSGEFGLFITKVNGREADGVAGEYWSITRDGIMAETGADDIAIADGDKYELRLLVWQG